MTGDALCYCFKPSGLCQNVIQTLICINYISIDKTTDLKRPSKIVELY